MRFSTLRRFAPITLLATAVLAVPTAASAVPPVVDEPLQPFDPIVFEAGKACEFPLSVAGTDPQGKNRTFVDQEGNVVRFLTSGRGYNLTFTNLATDEVLVMESRGSSQVIEANEDGTYSSTIRGSALIIQYPTDTPPGPATIVYNGRTVFTFKLLENGESEFLSLSSYGSSTDICAALS